MSLLKTSLAAGVALSALAAPALAERGSDGQLNLILWQAPSIVTPYLSTGTKDLLASSLVLEPLARYNEKAEMVPFLAAEIPTVGNGGVSEDLTSITWKLKDGIKWSDGSDFTAEDVAFTWEYCTNPEGGCAQLDKFEGVTSVEALDPLTVKITFDTPKPNPYLFFVGNESPIIQKAQFKDCVGAAAPTCTDANQRPVGTGPFVVTEFKTNDIVQYKANDLYRDPSKPAFATVLLKGGGDATAAARSVLETGEFDYAWNTQLAPEVISKMEEAGKGKVLNAFGTLVERIEINYTDPDPALGDERATVKHPHPILSDIRVREALSKAIDRALLVEIGYGFMGRMTCNLVPAPALYASTANDSCKTQDVAGAKALLDEAGWKPGPDGVRVKDGRRLSLTYQTSTNAVRQDFQALIKQWWSDIGVETELRNIDASVFFGGDPGSPDTFQKFYADVEMYANNFDGTDPEPYLGQWRCNNEPRPATQWQGQNIRRFCMEEYDALLDELAQTGDLEKRGEIARKLNDLAMQDFAMLPLVDRGRASAASVTLGGVKMNPWDSEFWNAADWYRVK